MDFKFNKQLSKQFQSKQLYVLFELLPIVWAQVPSSCIRVLSLTFYNILVCLKWRKTLWLYYWYHPPNSLILAKFCNTVIIILCFTCSIVFTTSSNQFLNLCSCNHWNWSLVARLVCFNFSDVLLLQLIVFGNVQPLRNAQSWEGRGGGG